MIQLRSADRHLTDGRRVMVASIRESSNVHYPPDSSLLESNAIAGGGASNCACSMLRARHAPRDRSLCRRPPGRAVGKAAGLRRRASQRPPVGWLSVITMSKPGGRRAPVFWHGDFLPSL